MKKGKLFFIIAMMSLLCACNFFTESGTSAGIEAVEQFEVKNIKMISNLTATGQVFGKDGMYELAPVTSGGYALMYLDYETGVYTCLCANPSCLHNNDTCFAWRQYPGALCLDDEEKRLFLFQYAVLEQGQPDILFEVSFSEGVYKELYRLQPEEMMIDGMAADSMAVYFSVRRTDPDTAVAQKYLKRVELATGAGIELLSLQDHEWLYGACKDFLLFLKYDPYNKAFEFYRYFPSGGGRKLYINMR